MGNTRSRQCNHEFLNENDEKYFSRIERREGAPAKTKTTTRTTTTQDSYASTDNDTKQQHSRGGKRFFSLRKKKRRKKHKKKKHKDGREMIQLDADDTNHGDHQELRSEGNGTPSKNRPSHQGNSGAEGKPQESSSSQSTNEASKYIFPTPAPLNENMNLSLSLPATKTKINANKTRHRKKTKSTSRSSAILPGNRRDTTKVSFSTTRSIVRNSLRYNNNDDIGPPLQLDIIKKDRSKKGKKIGIATTTSDKVISSDSDVQTPVSTTSTESLSPFQEYYTDMIADSFSPNSSTQHDKNSSILSTTTSSSSRRNTTRQQLQQEEEFRETFNSAMIWTSIPQPSNITCCTISRSSPMIMATAPDDETSSVVEGGESSSVTTAGHRLPLFLACGTEDGSVSVIHIIDNYKQNTGSNESTNASFMSDGESVSDENRKYGSIKTLSRGAKVRCIDFDIGGNYIAVGDDNCICSIICLGLEEGMFCNQNKTSSSPSPSNKESQRTSANDGNSVNGKTLNHQYIVPNLDVVAELEREDRVYATKWSPNGEFIAMGGYDGRVAIASFTAPVEGRSARVTIIKEIPRLGLVMSIDWNPSGSMLVAVGTDKRVRFIGFDKSQAYEPSSPREILSEILYTTSIQCIQYSPDGSVIAIAGNNGIVAIMDATSKKILREIRTSTASQSSGESSISRVHSLCFNPDGMFLSIVANDSSCVIVEMKTFIVVQRITRTATCRCLDWGREYLVVGGDDCQLALLKTGINDDASQYSYDTCSSVTDSDCGSSISSAASSQTGDWVLEEFKDIDDGQKVHKGNKHPRDKDISINAITFCHSNVDESTSQYAAVALSDGRVIVLGTDDWDILTEIKFPKEIFCMQFSNDNEYIVLGGLGTSAYIISVSKWVVAAEIKTGSSILSVGYSTNDERLALGLADGVVSFIQLENKNSKSWNIVGEMSEYDSPEYAVTCLNWSQDGKYLAIGRNDGTVSIHDSISVFANFYMPLTEIPSSNTGVGSSVHQLEFNPKGSFLAVGGDAGVTILDGNSDDWSVCQTFGLGTSINSLSWNLDGKFLAIGSDDLRKTSLVLETSTWQPVVDDSLISNEEEDINVISATCWSCDGDYFLFGDRSGAITILQTQKWNILGQLSYSDINSDNTK